MTRVCTLRYLGGVKPTVPRLVVWDAAICSMGDLPPSQQAIRRFCIAQNRMFLRFLIRNALLAKGCFQRIVSFSMIWFSFQRCLSPSRCFPTIFQSNRAPFPIICMVLYALGMVLYALEAVDIPFGFVYI